MARETMMSNEYVKKKTMVVSFSDATSTPDVDLRSGKGLTSECLKPVEKYLDELCRMEHSGGDAAATITANLNPYEVVFEKKKQCIHCGTECDHCQTIKSTEHSYVYDLKGCRNGEDGDFAFSLARKKRRKKPQELESPNGGLKALESGCDRIWMEIDGDYTYEELLGRAVDIMRANNPHITAGEKHKFVMKPPQIFRVGSKKTSFANFVEISRMLHRQPDHLQSFLLSELGTNGSIDGNRQLVIRGRFQQKQVEGVMRRYIKEYVTCHSCRSPDTVLQKDTRLFFLQCESCGSRCSVAGIKSGYQAVTGKRAAMRAKNV